MIVHYLKIAGINNVHAVWVKDEIGDTQRTIRQAQAESDIIISTGGISVGPHDHIPAAAEKLGFKTVFTQVAQKPGKPFYFARKEDTLYFGLPGNPVSAFMLFTYYVYPEIRWYRGMDDNFVHQEADLVSALSNDRDRTLLISARGFQENARWKTEPLASQASHKILPLVKANGFIIVPPHESYKKGDSVLFYFFPCLEV
jgi:molybdopterin molybdotransferase